MERALDPELLQQALGRHEALPSSEELAALLAEAELALLFGEPRRLSPKLIDTGWFLHGIASSKHALEVYGVGRQRAAFKVAAHIFDLTLQTSDLSYTEHQKYCFAAQIAYLRSELDPNSIALYKREFSSNGLEPLALLTDLHKIALSSGIALLGMDTTFVFRTLGLLKNEVNYRVREWGLQDIFLTPFGAASGVALGTRELMTFLVYGRREALNQARRNFRRAIQSEPSFNDQISRWVAAHLLNLADGLETSSIWTVLPPPISPEIVKAFAMGHPKILTLWPPQLELFKSREEQNPLSPNVERLFLSTPTSSGKTLLAQLLVISHLITAHTSVCYVAPTRSLCREIRKALESRLRYIDAEIVDGLPEGDWFDEVVTVDPQVEVMTPERLSYLLRSNSSRVLEQFGMFIFDEVHSLGDSGRGWTLEEDIAFLHHATQGSKSRIVLISAAVGNRNHFVQWMGEGVIHHHSDWRGPRRLHAIWTTEADKADGVEEGSRSREFPIRVVYPLYGKLDIRLSHTGELHSFRMPRLVGQLALKFRADRAYGGKDDAHSTAFYLTLIPLIQHLSQLGPVLVIESTKPATLRMAKALSESLPEIERAEIQSVIDLVESRLGQAHPLWQALQKGVAYHHGSLPSEIRSAIEEVVSQGSLKFLVATTTMTEGVNLPVRSVIIAAQGAHGDTGYVEYITGSKLVNAIGRAGRATKETEGIVVLARNTAPSPEDFERLSPSDKDMEILSNLATAKALDELAAFEELQRENEDAIFEVASKVITDFLKFVWFIAAQLEQQNHFDYAKLHDVLESTLAWTQLDQHGRESWFQVAVEVFDKYLRTPVSSRLRWAASGTSINSSRKLENIARELSEVILTYEEVPNDLAEVIQLIIGDGRLYQILALPEAPKRRVVTHRSGNARQEIDIPVDELLYDWLRGAELATIEARYFDSIPDVDFRFEQIGNFIYNHFEVFFPWVLGTIITWTNDLLEESASDFQLPKTIPANVRWGVGNPTALELMIRGIQSRTLALEIAELWEKEETDKDIRAWLQSLSLADWQRIFRASVAELRNLLEFSRNRKRGVAVELISKGYAEIEVETHMFDFPESEASLAVMGHTDLPDIGIEVEGELVGQIMTKDLSDIHSIMGIGLIGSLKFSATFGSGKLSLALMDPEA